MLSCIDTDSKILDPFFISRQFLPKFIYLHLSSPCTFYSWPNFKLLSMLYQWNELLMRMYCPLELQAETCSFALFKFQKGHKSNRTLRTNILSFVLYILI